MAIATLAGIVSGLQRPINFAKVQTSSDGNPGLLQDYWGYGGSPASGGFDTTLNGVTLSSTSAQVTGQLRFTDPNSGNCYLAKLTCSANNGTQSDVKGTLYLCDRLWHNGGIDSTITTQQNITSPTWPARDNAGATSGDGVLIALEASVGTGVTPGNFALGYTNSGGTSGRTGNPVSIATHQRKCVFEIGLQAGDTGVQSIQSITLAATGTFTYSLFAYRIITCLDIRLANKTFSIDAVKSGMPQMFNGSVPFFMFRPDIAPGGGFLPQLTGSITYAWG